ncbi:MAG TPA: SRPBCC family protein [Solirubrobacterales bacterium]
MGPVSAEVEIDVPRAQAFAFLADLANRPSFAGCLVSGFHLTRIDSTGIGAGARFRFDVPMHRDWADTTIVELDEPHRIVEHGHGGRLNRVPSTTVWELTEGPGSLTRVRVSYWTEPGLFDRAREAMTVASPRYERRWREAMRRLRDLLESGGSAAGRFTVAGGNRYATGIP